MFGIPHGSILGPQLFNAYICDLFYDINYIGFESFADDNTPYSCLSDMISVLGQLEGGIDKVFDWFKKKILKGNADKCHLTFIRLKIRSPEVVNSLFEFTNKNCNLKNASILKRNRFFTVHYGSESLVSLAPKIWELFPD